MDHRIVLPLAFQFRSNQYLIVRSIQAILITHRPPTRHLLSTGCSWRHPISRLVAAGTINRDCILQLPSGEIPISPLFTLLIASPDSVMSPGSILVFIDHDIYHLLWTSANREKSPQNLWLPGSYNLSPAKAAMGASFSYRRYPDPDVTISTVTAIHSPFHHHQESLVQSHSDSHLRRDIAALRYLSFPPLIYS
ncbi:uncharacterized protein ARMOST_10749 [Armillaria ostoyae]|uniref:Uncharacterized protein n=1 Tax=Armillaria ostoyae TaxID=47428 RepID=A0A284RF67_ARMOS|nr:uncharacterized protein ARMOST_10749 [Armillaria ostoyae]